MHGYAIYRRDKFDFVCVAVLVKIILKAIFMLLFIYIIQYSFVCVSILLENHVTA